MELLIQGLVILGLSFIQNIAFTITSRSRNRDNKSYHVFASMSSNVIWFLTFKQLITTDMDLLMLLPYIIGTTLGSVYGMGVSMKIEKRLGATADSHVTKTK